MADPKLASLGLFLVQPASPGLSLSAPDSLPASIVGMAIGYLPIRRAGPQDRHRPNNRQGVRETIARRDSAPTAAKLGLFRIGRHQWVDVNRLQDQD